jgi:prepilin-type N-terminal cleavage/methylation domain-containing protein
MLRSVPRRFSRSRQGFTLIELLVVIAIIAILIALLVPAVQKVRDAAARTQTTNNIKQVVLGLHGYHDAHKRFPAAWFDDGGSPTKARWTSHHFNLLPYVEQDNLFRSVPPNTEAWAAGAHDEVVPVFVSSQDASTNNGRTTWGWGAANVLYNWRLFGGINWWDRDARTRMPANIPDGTSNTIAYTTGYGNCQWYGQRNWAHPGWDGPDTTDPLNPINYAWAGFFFKFSSAPPQSAPTVGQCNPNVPQGFSAGTTLVGLADASVRSVSTSINPTTWTLACIPNDGEVLPGDWLD